jgi:hypothetical protein
MIRCTIELLPGGNESRARVIGLVEIANIGGTMELGEYAVVLKKTPPFAGALKVAWRRGRLVQNDVADIVGDVRAGEDAEIIAAKVAGHHRTRRGSYDLLYRALKACGLETRVPREERA